MTTTALHAPCSSVSAKSEGRLVVSVNAWASLSANQAMIDALRRAPGELQGRDLPSSFLKYAEEQSVCGFAAVLKAIHDAGHAIDAYREWGVIAAPRFPGRGQVGVSIARFFDQGVKGISPHAIPQNSLHSLSGVVSVGLGMGGPNLGAGGGLGAISEGLVTAFSMLAERRVPGFWFVATAWDREPIPQKNGRIVAEGTCYAVALALSALDGPAEGLCLSFDPAVDAAREPSRSGVDSVGVVIELSEALRRDTPASCGAIWKLELDWGAEVALSQQHSS
jgi:hypothetical protein